MTGVDSFGEVEEKGLRNGATDGVGWSALQVANIAALILPPGDVEAMIEALAPSIIGRRVSVILWKFWEIRHLVAKPSIFFLFFGIGAGGCVVKGVVLILGAKLCFHKLDRIRSDSLSKLAKKGDGTGVLTTVVDLNGVRDIVGCPLYRLRDMEGTSETVQIVGKDSLPIISDCVELQGAVKGVSRECFLEQR